MPNESNFVNHQQNWKKGMGSLKKTRAEWKQEREKKDKDTISATRAGTKCPDNASIILRISSSNRMTQCLEVKVKLSSQNVVAMMLLEKHVAHSLFTYPMDLINAQ